jgi:2-keto-4-pentenoate hydratase
MDEATVAAIADRLLTAERSREPIDQPSVEHPDMDASDAYRVQQAVVAARLAEGESIVGWKVGLTSQAMRDQLGVDTPDYGPILSNYLVPDGGSIPRSALIAPRVEAEIGFVLGAPLAGPGVTRTEVLAATSRLRPALEIIDSRIRDWKLTLPDTVADLASAARVVLGATELPPDGLDLISLAVTLERDGEMVATGTGAAVLGDPVEAVVWAVNTLGALGVTMEPGQVVIPGAMHAAAPAAAGQSFVARFDHLGTVSVRFAE